MLKKIFISIVLILIFIGTNYLNLSGEEVNEYRLQPLVVLKNSDVDLNCEGYKLTENNLDLNKVGDYILKYVSLESEQIYERKISVVSDEQLFNSFYCDNKEFSIKVDGNVLNIVEIKDGFACVVKNENIYNIFIKCGRIENLVNICDASFAEIVLLLNDDKYIYSISEMVFKDSSIDIILNKIDFYGNIIYTKRFGGSKIDSAKDALINEEEIIIGGYTISNDGSFEHILNSIDSFILRVNKTTGEVNNYYNLGILGTDVLEELYYDEYLYVIRSNYDENGNIKYAILKINNDGIIEKENEFNFHTEIVNIDLKKDYENLYFACGIRDNTRNEIDYCVFKIDEELSIEKYLDLYTKTYTFNSFDVCDDFIQYLYFDYLNNTFNVILYDGTHLTNYELASNCYYSFVKVAPNYLIGCTNNLIYFYSLDYLNAKISDIGILTVSLNNEEIEANIDKSNLNYNKEIFGNYFLSYYYETPNFDFFYTMNLFIPLDTNIENNNVYNRGLILKFNGSAILNGKIIADGYIINDVGEYTLEVTGNSDIKEVFNFKVDLLTKESSNTLSNIQISQVGEKQLNNQDLLINQSILKQESNNDYSNKLWYILLPICAAFISIFLYIVFRKKVF